MTTRRLPGTINLYGWIVVIFMVQMATVTGGGFGFEGMIADYPAEGVHFIDSGNYHYLTKFWTDKLETPFSLIVFDHHPDMQPPLFDNILSCGSWVKDILDHNNNCKKVIIVGSSDKLIQAVPKGYERQVRFYSETTLMHEEVGRTFLPDISTDRFTFP